MGAYDRAIAIYEEIRDLPYRTDSASDAVGLRASGRGNCVAKASLLAAELGKLGESVRLVSFEYVLPALVPVQRKLLFTTDVHTAAEVRRGDRWIIVDATHDPSLAALGLTVGRWDGETETLPAYPPQSPVFPHDEPAAMKELSEVTTKIADQVRATRASLTKQYMRDVNATFERCRALPVSQRG